MNNPLSNEQKWALLEILANGDAAELDILRMLMVAEGCGCTVLKADGTVFSLNWEVIEHFIGRPQ
jgi:hypothetical protein